MSNLRTFGTVRDRYAYKRLMVGIKWYRLTGKILRFLTLTGVDNNNGYRKNFDRIRRILRRRFGVFEYFAIRTNEGTNGVLHLLYVGKSFRYKELQKLWKRITGYWTVSISSVKNFKKIGFELTRQQMPVRYSQSRGWHKYEVQTQLFASMSRPGKLLEEKRLVQRKMYNQPGMGTFSMETRDSGKRLV